MSRLRGVCGAAILCMVALTGCGGGDPESAPTPSATTAPPTPSATPTPDPTAPAAEDLVLTTAGLGTLVIGEAPPTAPGTQMIAIDPAACSEFAASAGSPEASRWRPTAEYGGSASPMFGVEVLADVVTRIDVFTSAIPTDAGIRIGATASDLTSAYPAATETSTDLTDVFVVSDSRGTLLIEVARERGLFETAYWEPDQVDRVVFLRGDTAGTPGYTVAAGENIAGGCL